MYHPRILSIGLLLGAACCTPALHAADDGKNPCYAEPLFHCVEVLDDEDVIAHFGYRLVCPPELADPAGLDIPIGTHNAFSPGPADRGQPKFFLPGEHIDEFEAEFTARELRESGDIRWTVRDRVAQVDASRSADARLDCNRPR